MTKVDHDNKCKYVWFDTGLEYQATKDHIKYLEDEYGITIEKCKPKKPIPIAVRDYGVPFISKNVSEFISRLQSHDFQWEDEPYDVLIRKYPKCKSALQWWCNTKDRQNCGNNSMFNIQRNKYLKEFMIQNPPTFKISNRCCKFAKKDVAKDYNTDNDIDMSCVGVRKAEGGVRSAAYKSCFSEHTDKYDEFRPIFWYTANDKRYYEDHFSIEHSKCYTEYGLDRTGCVGCCFGKYFEKELEIVQKYEPKLYKACMNIFGKSYEYTRKYKEFAEEMKRKEKDERKDREDICAKE